MASATIRPNNPSAGKAPFHRKLHGSSPISAALDTNSTRTPTNLIYGELTGRERNQRTAYRTRNAGTRKAETPSSCKATSLPMAPKIPTQLCAGWPATGVVAVFLDGSSGEYDTSARTRKAAEISSRKPTSSLSRRFDVGVNTRVRVVIL